MLKPETLDYLREEAEKAGVTKMLLFGSCLYKPEDEAGDIDIAVEGSEKFDLFQFVGELLWTRRLSKRVDVVDLSDDLPISRLVRRKGVVIYDRQGIY